MSVGHSSPVRTAIAEKGWMCANRWLVLRRLSQLLVLAVFVAGPWFGIWIVKGNLASSLTLETLPLTDPLLLAQSALAGHGPGETALLGAAIVILFYVLVGGRVYCAWVCPINAVTDTAHWLRVRLGLRGGRRLSRQTRYWLLAGILVASALNGTIFWEMFNPVSLVFRGIVFGMGFAWAVVAGVFLLDFVVGGRTWCGHLCPVGAFYGLIGNLSVLRVSAEHRDRCDDCMDCFRVCPEQWVIKPALKGDPDSSSPIIFAGSCTNCARCMDVCAKDVFRFTTRFQSQPHRLQEVGR